MALWTAAAFLIPALFGIACLLNLRLFKEWAALILVGVTGGLAATVAATFLLTALLALEAATLTVLAIELVAAIVLLTRNSARQHRTTLTLDRTAAVLITALIILMLIIGPKLLSQSEDGLATGVINAWGDLGWHVATITLLEQSDQFLPENPIFAGERLIYPFFSNFFSAMLLALGTPLQHTVLIPAIVLITTIFGLLYVLTRNLTSNKVAAVIATLLLLCAGSTAGWLYIFQDFSDANQTLATFLTNLPRNYTGHSNNADNLYLINPLISLFLPQRSLLFGVPLALTIILLLTTQTHRRAFALAGIFAGLLPLFHAHTVLALVPVILALVVFYPRRPWASFFIPAAVIGTPGVLFYLTSTSAASALPHQQIGWMADAENPALFWLRNSGLLLLITAVGLALSAPRQLKVLALAGLVIFTAGNIWIFARWEWDNTKLFLYWLIFTLPLIAYLTARLYQQRRWLLSTSVSVVVILHLASGALDIWQLAVTKQNQWGEWDTAAIQFAEQIKQHTKSSDVILSFPQHNSPVALTGRPLYLGFPGHAWSHGYDQTVREPAIGQFYQGRIATLPEVSPQYVVVGPTEQRQYPSLVVQPAWRPIINTGSYQLYQVAD